MALGWEGRDGRKERSRCIGQLTSGRDGRSAVGGETAGADDGDLWGACAWQHVGCCLGAMAWPPCRDAESCCRRIICVVQAYDGCEVEFAELIGCEAEPVRDSDGSSDQAGEAACGSGACDASKYRVAGFRRVPGATARRHG